MRSVGSRQAPAMLQGLLPLRFAAKSATANIRFSLSLRFGRSSPPPPLLPLKPRVKQASDFKHADPAPARSLKVRCSARAVIEKSVLVCVFFQAAAAAEGDRQTDRDIVLAAEKKCRIASQTEELLMIRVARWQNLIPSFPWIAPGWRAWGRNPRKGRDQILQRSVAEP